MKTFTLMILGITLFFQTDLPAQINKGQHILSLTGGYQRFYQDGLTSFLLSGGNYYSITNEARTTSARYTPSFAFVLKKKWIFGIGAEVRTNETKINPRHKEVPTNSGSTLLLVRTSSRTTGNTISPFLLGEYFHPVSQKFYLSGILSINYSFEKNNSESEYFTRDPTTGNLGPTQISKNQYRSQSYSILLSPAFRYQMRPHFGLQLTCGGFYLGQTLDDSRLADYEPMKPSFSFDVRPAGWGVGIYVNR